MTPDVPHKHRLRPVIRVFISSTFSDMKQERNALQTDVFPKLERYCRQNGFQFQAIDLRWGVSSEAAFDHRTMRICFDELRRAQEISPRPNFLILLGDRYGWRPLPEEISVEEYRTLEQAAGQLPANQVRPAIKVLSQWYRLDENVAPSIYLLQSRRQNLGDGKKYTDHHAWNVIQDILWTIINHAMPVDQMAGRFGDKTVGGEMPPAIVRFHASATEQEIWRGALSVTDAKEHVLACFREIENLKHFSNNLDRIKDFVDVSSSGGIDQLLHAEQKRLKEELNRTLIEKNVGSSGNRVGDFGGS